MFIAGAILSTLTCATPARASKVSIAVDTNQQTGPLNHIARFFGCDEPNYAYYPDGKHLLGQLGSLGPHQTYFRTHNLLTTCDPLDDTRARLKWGCTNAYTEDSQGRPVYNWTIIDRIFDTYLDNNVRPYVQIGFMPKALARDPEPYTFNFTGQANADFIYTGWSHPPTDWNKWYSLVHAWAMHCVERYGMPEVESWYWEVWNEPNIAYWNGTADEYKILYDYSVHAVREAIPRAQVGGAEVAGGADGDYLQNFIQHTMSGHNLATKSSGSPLDFVSFHTKGAPTFVNKSADVPAHQQMNISAALTTALGGFKTVAQFPSLEGIPIIIGEDDPDPCAGCRSPAVDYRNGLHYPSYTAASFVRQLDLAQIYQVNLEGTLTWAFEYDDQPWFEKYRVLSTNQVAKPILNLFRMFGKMSGYRVEATSTAQVPLGMVLDRSIRNEADVGVLASYNASARTASILIWHYHDDALPRPDAEVSLSIHPPARDVNVDWWHSPSGHGRATVTQYRIDETHSNAYATWLRMGSPQDPSPQQIRRMQEDSELAQYGDRQDFSFEGNDTIDIQFTLGIQATHLLLVQFKNNDDELRA